MLCERLTSKMKLYHKVSLHEQHVFTNQAEQVVQDLFGDGHVQRLFHQRDPVPRALTEHDVGQVTDLPAPYPSYNERGSKMVVCVREFKNEAAGEAPYSLIGLCDFVKYDGSRPIIITWKLRRPIPVKYLRKTGKLVV